jgi:hypothetical protein
MLSWEKIGFFESLVLWFFPENAWLFDVKERCFSEFDELVYHWTLMKLHCRSIKSTSTLQTYNLLPRHTCWINNFSCWKFAMPKMHGIVSLQDIFSAYLALYYLLRIFGQDLTCYFNRTKAFLQNRQFWNYSTGTSFYEFLSYFVGAMHCIS